jgi:predicted phage terminase large subunit-like protein
MREKARRRNEYRKSLGLVDLIPELSPHLDAPHHLAPIADLIQRSLTEPLEFVSNTPPQHGKTELIAHGFAWLAKQAPARRHVYATYSAERACDVSDHYRAIAREYGLEPRGRRTRLSHAGGGSVQFVGRDGLLVGSPADGLIMVDDPIKNRTEAESPAVRSSTVNWLREVVLTRRHPSATVGINMTRWHVLDLAGEMVRSGWHHVNLAALALPGDPLGRQVGEPLWPEGRPLDFLSKQQDALGGENGFSWVSLYQGVPRRRGGSVFDGVATYDALPERAGLRFSLGVDLAYSTTTRADWSVIVAVAMDREGTAYVLQVWREQKKAEDFAPVLRLARLQYPTAKMRWYGAGAEKGVAGLLNALAKLPTNGGPPPPQLRLDYMPATTDKLVRALPVSAAWNRGRVLVPQDAPWLEAFLSELADFTGLGEQDDQVDALAAAYDLVETVPMAGHGAVVLGQRAIPRNSMV